MPRRFDADADHNPADEGLSRTQRKQAAHDLQDLADALIDLPEAELARIEMEDALRDALREAHSIRSFEARRRHAKYIGKLLRQMDAEPLQAAIAAIDESRMRQARALQVVERWRDQLIADDAALTTFVSEYRNTDLQALRSAIRAARREAAAAPPFTGGPPVTKGRYYRELFKLLRQTMNAAAVPPSEDE